MTFCKLLYHRKYKWAGGQKKTNLVNVVCEHPLSESVTKDVAELQTYKEPSIKDIDLVFSQAVLSFIGNNSQKQEVT